MVNFEEFSEGVTDEDMEEEREEDHVDVREVEKKDYGSDFIDDDLDELGTGFDTSCDLCHEEKKICGDCIEMPSDLKEFYDFPVLNPVQSDGLRYLNDGEEAIIATSGTGTGKTVILEIGMLRWLTKRDDDEVAFVLVPLKMLADEKVTEWRERFGDYVNVIELTSDTKSDIIDRDNMSGSKSEKLERQLMGYDVIVTSYEMFSSLTTKKNMDILNRVGFLGIDEIHNLSDKERGGELEGALIRYMLNYNYEVRADVVSLSATFDNMDDLEDFLRNFDYDSKTVAKDWSPIKRFWHGPISYMDRDKKFFDTMIEAMERDEDSKILGLVYSKPCVEDTAQRINEYYGEDVAVYHHAGMRKKDRKEVEDKYQSEDNSVRVLIATPTIAQGVNLPGDSMVLVCDYYDGIEKEVLPLTKQEVDQIAGRAGRPQYGNKEAHVYTVIKSSLESEFRGIMEQEIRVDGTLYNKLDLVMCEELHKREGASKTELKEWLDDSFSEVTSADARNFDEIIEYLTENGHVKWYGDTLYNEGKGRSCAISMVRPLLLDRVLAILEKYDSDELSTEKLLDFAEKFYALDYTENFKDVKKDLLKMFSYDWMMDNGVMWHYHSPSYPQYDTIEEDMQRVDFALELMGYDNKQREIVQSLKEMLPYRLYKLKKELSDCGVEMVGTKRLALLWMNDVNAGDVRNGVVPDELIFPKIIDTTGGIGLNSIDQVDVDVIETYPREKYNKIYSEGKWRKDCEKIRNNR